MGYRHPSESSLARSDGLVLPLEVRVHGRGGQGGVTCAKLIAALYTQMGLHVQTFGDYGSERSGAPVQAYTRVDRTPIRNRNKIYRPDHLIVLDEGLIGAQVLQGIGPGTVLLLNTHAGLEAYRGRFEQYRLGVVDATAIAREQGIGSSSVVIINTTILGAYARLLGLPLAVLEQAYVSLGLGGDFPAAQHAYEQVRIAEPLQRIAPSAQPAALGEPAPVAALTDHDKDVPPTLKTGTWSNQIPVYGDHSAPCNLACPAGNDVVGFVQALRGGNVEEAAAILLRTQPLPSVCGRVCPAPCMQNCNRSAFDGAVNIRGLERWIGDHAELSLPSRRDAALHVAIVGGGPAGLSAAYQLALRGHDVTIYEAGPALGGVLRNGIPSFRLPQPALERDIDRIRSLGVHIRCNARLGGDDLRNLRRGHDAVIVCVGFGPAVDLAANGHDLTGIRQGLDFLAAAKQERVALPGDVVVVGGGNTAIDCARTALRCGAATVTIAYRRARQDMPAIAEEIEEAEREGVRFLFHRLPVAFTGSAKVSTAVLAEVEAGSPDASGRRRPVVTGRTSSMPCDAVLLALGQKSGLDLLPDGWTMKDGRAHEGGQALPVWFAGDCATGEGTVTHAVGNGRLAALAVLEGRAMAAAPADGTRVAPGQIRFSHFDLAAPNGDRQHLPSRLAGNFDEVNLGLADPGEAERCFSCGHCTRCDTCLVSCPDGVIYRTEDGYRVDGEYCKGCGMCAAECPRSAMEMQEKHEVTP
ncbi:MAG: FAD-dependent oxidoreductase [Alphaproteobacteria bacterium]|nr:FAD-dependent oxidoreductase [Alphaproteobacteria bacterium]